MARPLPRQRQTKTRGGFTRKSDAEAFDAKLKRDRSLGVDLARELNRGRITLDDFVRGGFRSHAALRSTSTRNIYAWALTNHLSELVDEPLVALDVPRLAQHQQHLLEHGRKPGTVREVMQALSVILGVAVAHGLIPFNPVRGLTKVPAGAREHVEVLSPEQLERLIARLDGRDRAVAVLGGHLGLRPIEIRNAVWRNLHDDHLTIPATSTKPSAARTRIIEVPRATSAELKRWRLASGRPGDREPIVGEFTANAQRLWNRRVLRPHVDARRRPRRCRALHAPAHARLDLPLRRHDPARGGRAARARADPALGDLRARDPEPARPALRQPRRRHPGRRTRMLHGVAPELHESENGGAS